MLRRRSTSLTAALVALRAGLSQRESRGAAADNTASLLPQHQKWITYFRVKFLAFWLVISAAGVLLAILPVSFSLKDMLSGAIVGAGIAGIFSEFSFCSERRDDDRDRQVLQLQLTSVKRQLRQIDRIITDTAIVATLKTFNLGSMFAELLLNEHASTEERDQTQRRYEELAEILGLAQITKKFSNQPKLFDPEGPILFKEIKEAIQLRFSLAVQEAFSAGYAMKVAIFGPGTLTNDEVKRTLLAMMRKALPLLYLPRTLPDYLDRGLSQFERGELAIPEFVHFLGLFDLYIISRVMMTAPEIISFFETDQPSLTNPATDNAVVTLLRKLMGNDSDNADGRATPLESQGSSPNGDDSTADPLPQERAWISYFRVKFLVFWLVISVGGVLLAVLPVSFSLKDMLSGTIVGAGIAGIFSEFSFCSVRRDDDRDRQVLQLQLTGVDRQLGQIDSITTDTEIVAALKTFKLGSCLGMVQVGENLPTGSRDQARHELNELAEILGVSRVISKYLDGPNLLGPQAVGPFMEIKGAVELRFSPSAQQAFHAGYVMALCICTPATLADGQEGPLLISIMRRAYPLLYLPGTLPDYLDRSLSQFERGELAIPEFVHFLSLFNTYITSRVMNGNPEVISFFETDQPSLTETGTDKAMLALMTKLLSKDTVS